MREPALLGVEATVRGSAMQRSEGKKVFGVKLIFSPLNYLLRIREEWLRDFELLTIESKATEHYL